MKSKIIEIFSLILYVNLINIPFVLAGKYCIAPSLVQYGYNIRILGCMQDLYESEFFICLLVMYFVLTAKYKVKSFMFHVHRVGDAIQPSHPLSSPSPPAPNPSQHQGLFQ